MSLFMTPFKSRRGAHTTGQRYRGCYLRTTIRAAKPNGTLSTQRPSAPVKDRHRELARVHERCSSQAPDRARSDLFAPGKISRRYSAPDLAELVRRYCQREA